MSTIANSEIDEAIDIEDEAFHRKFLEENADGLLDISHEIHANPEIRFEETAASALLVSKLEEAGFAIQLGVGGLPTAFLAEYGSASDGPTIAFFLEYDALEEIGHACGHNVIATIGLGAAMTVQSWMRDHGRAVGRLLVVGSPGEEGGGGKQYLIKAGCLDGIDAALMMHPSGENLSCMTTLGRVALDFEFTGKAAHAAVTPHHGVNALDAAVLTLNAIGLLRQQLPSDVRVHAIVLEGGEAPNVIPEKSVLRAYIRAADTRALVDDLQPRVENCARGAAIATGTQVSIIQQSPTYAALQPNAVLGDLVERNFARVGRRTEPPRTEVFPGSTDMGNVSQIIPSIHPNIEFVPGLGMHTREAAEYAGAPEGDKAVLDGSLILAMTASQLFSNHRLVGQVKAAFSEGVRVD
ncbi:M20 family metallopeptidase [Rhodococcus opacus]|uniref:M20 family metallopeptidase n=1 Tax=Rhodococcus opacus TaxID=37919 RepID=UPI001F5A577D|nr:M20 family metallopeptidase [Rhodococcus opacus]UNN01192.1 M20 family metallopeptidase [Rhodococcus opacus]